MSTGTQKPFHASCLPMLPPTLPAFLAPWLRSCHWKPLLAAFSLHCARFSQEFYYCPKTYEWSAPVAIFAFLLTVLETLLSFRLLSASHASSKQKISTQGHSSRHEIVHIALEQSSVDSRIISHSTVYTYTSRLIYWMWTLCQVLYVHDFKWS